MVHPVRIRLSNANCRGGMMPKTSERLENKVRECRNHIGLSQVELATLVGVTRQTIIALEKARYVPSLVLALRIARTFDRPIEELFFFPEEGV